MKIAVAYATGNQEELDELLKRILRGKTARRLFLEELFVHLSLVLGFPTMLDGLERLQRILPAKPRTVTNVITKNGGMTILRRIYVGQAKKLLSNLRVLHPHAAHWIVKDVYGKIFSRRGLSLQERELINVVILSVQGLERQLYSHIRGAVRVGVTPGQLRDALKVVRPAGKKRYDVALQTLRAVVYQAKK